MRISEEPSRGVDRIAAVVIGRNEGDRLIQALASACGAATRIVYVDSGSTDGSVVAAQAAGAEAVELDLSTPFTAARARNAGVAALGEAADVVYVQFVDGDCEIVPGWIEAAATFLDEHPDAAVVCGRRRERAPEASVYNRLCDLEWNTPAGEAAACGGDSLMRLTAFRAVGGFDPALICGEEPELCLRLRRAGWRVVRLDREMTRHDAGMTRFGQWWRRTVRAGWAWAEGAAHHGAGPERYNRRELRRVWLWGAGLPAAVIVVLALAAGLDLSGSGLWPAALLLALGGLALYPLAALRVAYGRRARFGDSWPQALAYGGFVTLGKFAELQGALRYRANHRRGETPRLIEYKDATSRSA